MSGSEWERIIQITQLEESLEFRNELWKRVQKWQLGPSIDNHNLVKIVECIAQSLSVKLASVLIFYLHYFSNSENVPVGAYCVLFSVPSALASHKSESLDVQTKNLEMKDLPKRFLPAIGLKCQEYLLLCPRHDMCTYTGFLLTSWPGE